MRSPKFGWKNRFNFGENLFFGDHLILTQKPPQFGSRLMKIWVEFVYCSFHLSKKPAPPLRNPGYAPGMFNVPVLIFCHLIASKANCLMMHKSFLAITTSCLEKTVTYMLRRVARNSQWGGLFWGSGGRAPSRQRPTGYGGKAPSRRRLGFGGKAPTRRRHGGLGAEFPALENFAFFLLK